MDIRRPQIPIPLPFAAVAALLIVVCGLGGCGERDHACSFHELVMGTVAGGTIHARSDAAAAEAASAVRAVYDSVNTVMSSWDTGSELSRLNRAPADSAVGLSPWLNACLAAADSLRARSGGAFDPTAEPLMRLWGFYRREGRLPSAAALDSARALMGGYVHDAATATVVKTTDGTHFDLGGIAKGFAVDEAVAELKRRGANSALLDLGGNLYMLGSPPGRELWRIGVRDPRDPKKYIAAFAGRDLAVATSGAYERFVTIDGRRYGHIMNPATGRPAEGLLSATVICASATLADGLSTTLFVLGPARALDLLREGWPGVEAVLVLPPAEAAAGKTKARVVATPGLAGNLELNATAAAEYELVFADRTGVLP